ncbi:phage tail tube protein [Escherichia coli]|uniref:phage tail tube protein n=1 Tax=Escherichia coli TaxID=562 RepID=UPI002FCD4123
MAKILGMATIRVNGREIKTEGKSTLNPGGFSRTQHMGGGKVWGISSKMASPSIKVTIAAAADMDVIEISSWEDVTVMFYGDNGLNYMMTGPPRITRRSWTRIPAPSVQTYR